MQKKKKLLLSILICAFMLVCCTAVVKTATSAATTVEYSFDSETGTLTISGADIITKSGVLDAISDSSSLKEVIINEGITSIESSAFYNCSNLTNITIPNTVTSIGTWAFRNCTALTSITIPNGVTSISSWVFEGCTGLTKIVVDSDNNNYCDINGVLFNKDATELVIYPLGETDTSYTIPDGVTTIGNYAFDGCTGLTSITIPDSVTNISIYAFQKCTSLTSIVIPDRVTSIGMNAFNGCKALTSVTLPSSISKIGNSSFYGCSSLATVYYAGTYEQWSKISIGSSNSKLTSAKFIYECNSSKAYSIGSCGENVAYKLYSDGELEITGEGAMNGSSVPWSDDNDKITKITIADSVTNIIGSVFYDTSFYKDDSNWEDDSLYIGNHLIKVKSTVSARYTVKTGTISITDSAFSNCINITSIIVPDGVTNIGAYAFYGCTNLVTVTLPKGVISIGKYAFLDCSSLFSIQIPDSVTSIGDSAFSNCESLISVTLPSGVTGIGKFTFNECKNLASIKIPSGVTSIGSCAFYGCKKLTSVTIPNSVTSIGVSAFRECTGLTSVTLSNNITEVSDYAFYGCSSITNITLPSGVTRIGKSAFCNCSSLNEVHYIGTEEQWKEVSVETGNDAISTADFYFHNSHTFTDGVCTVCGYVCDHVNSETKATCEENAKCSICGLEISLTGHKYGNPQFVWADDNTAKITFTCENDSAHKLIYDCTVTNETEKIATCTENGKIIYTATYTYNDVDYSDTKEVAIQADGHRGGVATCSEQATCEVCLKKYGNLNSKNHTKSQKWIQTPTTHKKVWECCNSVVVSEEEHEWKNGICTECGYTCNHTGGIATCTEQAICEACKEKYGEVDLTNHTGGTEIKNAVAATCTKEGYTGDTYCLGCKNQISSGSPTAALGHGTTEIRNAAAATCTKAGYTGDTYCTVCNEKLADGSEIKALGHKGGTATCTEQAICEACKEKYGEVDLTNHTGGTEIKNAVAATCTKEGYSGDVYCKSCSKKIKSGNATPTTGHTGGKATCTETGKCAACGAEYIPVICHNMKVESTKKATFFTNGSQTSKCTECGKTETVILLSTINRIINWFRSLFR